MSPAGLGEGSHNVKGYPVERGLYDGHGNEGVSCGGPGGYPLALGAPLAVALNIPLNARPIEPGKDPLPGLVHAQVGPQEVGVGHKKHLTNVGTGHH